MGRVVAFDTGDERNIWVLTPTGLEEVTPIEDTTAAAAQMAVALGGHFYLRRIATNGKIGWAAYSTTTTALKPKWFPTQDSAVMYAAMKGG